MIRTGTPTTSHHLLEGVLKPRKEFGGFLRAHEKPAIKLKLQNSRNRKAPITLATTPFDHKTGESV